MFFVLTESLFASRTPIVKSQNIIRNPKKTLFLNNYKSKTTMKSTLFLIVIILSFAAHAQNSEPKILSSESKKLFLGVNLSPDICYRTLRNNDGNNITSRSIDLHNQIEIPKLGYTFGLNISYNFNKQFGIETGVQFSNKGYANKKIDLRSGQPSNIDPTKGFTTPTLDPLNSAVKLKIVYNHLYLDIPLRVNFKYGENKIRFISSIGLTTNIFLKATQTNISEYKNGKTKRRTSKQQESNYKLLDVSPTISAGIEYWISPEINLRMEPIFRYGVLKIIDTPITGYLWNAGLNIAFFYKIKQ
jgi:hypothetical protein